MLSASAARRLFATLKSARTGDLPELFRNTSPPRVRIRCLAELGTAEKVFGRPLYQAVPAQL